MGPVGAGTVNPDGASVGARRGKGIGVGTGSSLRPSHRNPRVADRAKSEFISGLSTSEVYVRASEALELKVNHAAHDNHNGNATP
jgi:hypothetical protein